MRNSHLKPIAFLLLPICLLGCKMRAHGSSQVKSSEDEETKGFEMPLGVANPVPLGRGALEGYLGDITSYQAALSIGVDKDASPKESPASQNYMTLASRALDNLVAYYRLWVFHRDPSNASLQAALTKYMESKNALTSAAAAGNAIFFKENFLETSTLRGGGSGVLGAMVSRVVGEQIVPGIYSSADNFAIPAIVAAYFALPNIVGFFSERASLSYLRYDTIGAKARQTIISQVTREVEAELGANVAAEAAGKVAAEKIAAAIFREKINAYVTNAIFEAASTGIMGSGFYKDVFDITHFTTAMIGLQKDVANKNRSQEELDALAAKDMIESVRHDLDAIQRPSATVEADNNFLALVKTIIETDRKYRDNARAAKNRVDVGANVALPLKVVIEDNQRQSEQQFVEAVQLQKGDKDLRLILIRYFIAKALADEVAHDATTNAYQDAKIKMYEAESSMAATIKNAADFLNEKEELLSPDLLNKTAVQRKMIRDYQAKLAANPR